MRAATVTSGGLLGCILLGGCVDSDAQALAGFDTPSGLTVAGTARSRLFVSNSAQDTVQVLDLGEHLDEINFVFGPARRFPLRIPAGLGPGDLATTFDRRYVVVLNLVSESLRLIDADTLLLVRDAKGEVLQLPLGKPGSRPTAMVASPVACEGECVGRVYVALAGSGSVLGVDVTSSADGLRLDPARVYAVGGEPSALA
ncbi:YncE family protein, partial [Myxococcota bacterium]